MIILLNKINKTHKNRTMQREQMLEDINRILDSLSDKALEDLLTFLKDVVGGESHH